MPEVGDLPFVYKIDVQQGNVVTQEMLGQLHRGMDKKKVRFVMGTPILEDTFHAKRWDYIYTFQEGGGDTERRHMTLIFENEKLDRVEGDIKPALGQLVVDTRQDMSVKVPYEYKPGIFAKLKQNMPFSGDDKQADSKGTDGEEAPDDAAAVVADAGTAAEEAQDAGLPPDLEEAQEEVLVPEDTPTKDDKKGFFRRFLDRIGVGQGESQEDYDPGDPKYRDPSNPEDL